MAKRQVKVTGLDALREKYKDFGGWKVIERRFEHPDDPGTLAIRLKDEPDLAADPQGQRRIWHLRWINAQNDGRWSRVVDSMGYVPVQVDELQSRQSVTGLLAKTEDGIVRRGDRGHEVLVKMPHELYTALKQAKQDRLERRLKNRQLVRQDLADAAGAQLGDEAGTMVEKQFSVEIRQHRSTYRDELQAE